MSILSHILNAPINWTLRRLLSDPKGLIQYKDIIIIEDDFDGGHHFIDPLFVEKTKATLDFIEETDPLRFKRVQRFIKVIFHSNRALASYNHKLNSCSVGFAHFHFEDDAPHKIPWYACTLIHEATHGVFHSRKIPYTKRTREKVEYFCVLEEWKFAQGFIDDDFDWYTHIWTKVTERAWDSVWNESKVHRAKTIFRANANGELENRHNQQVDPIVKTPVDEVEAQGTQGHV